MTVLTTFHLPERSGAVVVFESVAVVILESVDVVVVESVAVGVVESVAGVVLRSVAIVLVSAAVATGCLSTVGSAGTGRDTGSLGWLDVATDACSVRSRNFDRRNTAAAASATTNTLAANAIR